MLANLGVSAREKLIRGERLIERTVTNGDSNKYTLRKMKKYLRSQPTYEITDAGRASVKYKLVKRKRQRLSCEIRRGNKAL
ncbi:hypothetical protein DPMN_079854 [Dreissena polymorpha]|uniref:Uncharacterized protein n=1 Tax=Dreissena polymorpha TaxID=45954 RepID=A0A9D4BRB1_DREPO|nr:hypothetical protein DPMN_079854 [Dreissena polymorpha]